MSFAIIAQQAGLVVAQGFAPNCLKHKADSQAYFSCGARLRSGNITVSYQGNQFQSPNVQRQSPVPPDATFWHLIGDLPVTPILKPSLTKALASSTPPLKACAIPPSFEFLRL